MYRPNTPDLASVLTNRGSGALARAMSQIAAMRMQSAAEEARTRMAGTEMMTGSIDSGLGRAFRSVDAGFATRAQREMENQRLLQQSGIASADRAAANERAANALAEQRAGRIDDSGFKRENLSFQRYESDADRAARLAMHGDTISQDKAELAQRGAFHNDTFGLSKTSADRDYDLANRGLALDTTKADRSYELGVGGLAEQAASREQQGNQWSGEQAAALARILIQDARQGQSQKLDQQRFGLAQTSADRDYEISNRMQDLRETSRFDTNNQFDREYAQKDRLATADNENRLAAIRLQQSNGETDSPASQVSNDFAAALQSSMEKGPQGMQFFRDNYGSKIPFLLQRMEPNSPEAIRLKFIALLSGINAAQSAKPIPDNISFGDAYRLNEDFLAGMRRSGGLPPARPELPTHMMGGRMPGESKESYERRKYR